MDSSSLFSHIWIAHRGLFDHNHWRWQTGKQAFTGYGAKIIPENSRPAFQAAIENGFAIETDISMGKDGIPLVFHDDDLMRMTGIKGKIGSVSLEHLEKIQLLGSEETIPSLKDLLELVSGQVPLFIEIKVEEPFDLNAPLSIKFLDNVLEELEYYNGVFALQSFCPQVVAWLKKQKPDYFYGIIAYTYLDQHGLSMMEAFKRRNLLYALDIRPDFISYDIMAINNHAPQYAKKLGMPLICYTVDVNTRDQVTDHPELDGIIFEGFLPKIQR